MNFPSIRLEGAILTADLLDAIAREDKHSQKSADFGLDPSTKVKDEIASTWASAKALWTGYQAKIAALHEGQTGVSETRNLFIIPLVALLGYQPEKTEAETVNGKSYAISHRDISRDGFPLHIMGWHDSLEKKRDSGGPRISSHALVQEYLNLTEHSYGIITNGRQLRLLRDSSRLIKLSFLEFDLNRIFEEDLYADFAILFRLLHATRMPANRAHASGSVIEKYHQESVDSGSRIRDGLAAAVAFSMQTVANGLLAHPANASLVEQLRKEPARANELHQNLLRWVYRTLFVLVIEERVLHHTPTATLRQRQLYRDYYSLQRLRRLADRPQLADRRAHDLWRAMHQTLRLYEDGGKGLPLGIAPLGSFLFREEGLQHLFQYQLDNRSLLQTLNRLSTFTHPDTNVRMRVNYGALDVEEFGSVYESLLELRPRIIPEGDKLSFSYAQLAGNERKTSGSYYTPDSLVQCLLDSALDPVIEERLAEAPKGRAGSPSRPLSGDELRQAQEKALLAIKICDPAVGSGHFLIGAAHRLAQRLADIRAGEEALSPDVQRHALRDVVSHCLYGVDINPLSVELCKVSLWMLAMEPGKPLSFLDHHIGCGNSILGTTPELVAEGIPDDAFNAIEGDDKQACAELKKQNKAERKGFGALFIKEDAANREKLQKAVSAIDEIGDDSPEAIRRKEAAFKSTQQNYDFQKARDLANLWCAAFVIKKHFPATTAPDSALPAQSSDLPPAPTATQAGLFGGTEETPKAKGRKLSTLNPPPSTTPIGVTTQHLRDFAAGGALPDGLLAEAKRLADQYRFFHFHLAFPEVLAQAGFDVILGNPPWDKVELMEKEWFSDKRADIANAQTGAKRKRLIESLKTEDPLLFASYLDASRSSNGERHFIQSSGRYPLCGSGRINTYATFAETARLFQNPAGRIGCVLPSGIGTDDTTKLFFQKLVETETLSSFLDFENKLQIFPGVAPVLRFCLLTLNGSARPNKTGAQFIFFAQRVEDLLEPDRKYSLTSDEIRLINPNSLTAPIFRTRMEAEIAKHIYAAHPVLIAHAPPANPWKIMLKQGLLNMTSDSEQFVSKTELEARGYVLTGNRFVKSDDVFEPMWEAKLVHQFDHRRGSFAGLTGESIFNTKAATINPTSEEKANPHYVTIPRYWVNRKPVEALVPNFWSNQWFIAFRDIIQAMTNARCAVFTVIPRCAVSNKLPIVFPHDQDFRAIPALLATLNSFVFDFCTRQKIGGTSLNFYILEQLPVVSPAIFHGPCRWSGQSELLRDWLLPRVLELTYTAWDLEAFAQDCGWSGPPFRWDEERRFLLRCELDAAFFHLYLGSEEEWRKQPVALTQAFPTPRDAVSYIMDTFPIVKRKDEAKFNGDYRTKRTILEIYDAFAVCMQTGMAYQTRLDPPPSDPRCCHPMKS